MIIICYPYTYDNLVQMEQHGCITVSHGELVIIDIKKTLDMKSINYLLKDSFNDYYIITAKRIPYLRKYGMSNQMPLAENEIYIYNDFSNEVTITRFGEMITCHEKKTFPNPIILWPLPYIFAVHACFKHFIKTIKKNCGK